MVYSKFIWAKKEKEMAQMVQDVSKRLLIESAFLNYGCLQRASDADIAKLYTEVEKLNKLSEVSEEALEKVIKYEIEDIKSKEDLKQRIHQMRLQTAEKIFDTVAQNSNEAQVCAVLEDIGIAGKMANRYARQIFAHKLHEELSEDDKKTAQKCRLLLGRQSKNKEQTKIIWADQLASNLFDKIDQLKKNTFLDLQTYQDAKINIDLIEEMLPEIKSNLGNLKINLNYTIRDENRPFNEQVRADCNRADGVKENFNKIIGILAENGKNAFYAPHLKSNYETFAKQMAHVFPQNAEEALNLALSVDTTGKTPQTAEAERQQNYLAKSKELYLKLMVSLLAKKYEYDHKGTPQRVNYKDYAQNIERFYITGLKNGENKVNVLGFIEPDVNANALSYHEEIKRAKDIWSATVQEKSASFHHHLPVGAAFDVSQRLFGRQSAEENLKNACALVNNVGNGCLVIGKEKHQSMEAKGNYVVTQTPINTVFAARFSIEAAQNALRSLPNGDPLKEAGAKYATQTDLSVSMNLGEHPQMSALRQTLKTENKSTMLETYRRLYKTMNEW